MARFLVDADMPARTAKALRANEYDAVDVRELEMAAASDAAIFEFAQAEGRAVISRDVGFAGLAGGSPAQHGFVLLRFAGLRSDAVIEGLLGALESLGARSSDLAGAVVVVEPGRARIRRVP